MKKLALRTCVLVAAVVIFACSWTTIAARPWQAEPKEPRNERLLALQERERYLHARAKQVQRLVKARWSEYRHDLKERQRAIAAAEREHQRQLKEARAAAAEIAAARARAAVRVVSSPVVSVVSLPPVTKTKSS